MANLKINGDTSGSVTLAAPATGSAVTLTLPAATGTVALSNGTTYTGTHNFTGATVSGVFPASATATVATNQTTTSLSFVDLATAGPAVTVTTGTKALVTVTARWQGGGAGYGASVGYAVSGATTVAATDISALRNEPNGVVNAPAIRYSATTLITGLSAGSNVFTAKYKALSGGTSEFSNRDISVIDLGS